MNEQFVEFQSSNYGKIMVSRSGVLFVCESTHSEQYRKQFGESEIHTVTGKTIEVSLKYDEVCKLFDLK